MRLRDHPQLNWSSIVGSSGARFTSGGEEDVLKDVQTYDASPSMPARLNLEIEFEGGMYGRHLFATDSNLLKSLYPTLKGLCGLPIGQILDRDF